jgi:hypothetical protein
VVAKRSYQKRLLYASGQTGSLQTILALPDEIRAALYAAPFEDVAEPWEIIETRHGALGQAWLRRNDRYYAPPWTAPARWADWWTWRG